MPKALILFFTILLFASCKERKLQELKASILGSYEGTLVGSYSDVSGATDNRSSMETFEIEDFSSDSILINGVRVYFDESMRWGSVMPIAVGYRNYYYWIIDKTLTVKYYSGGNGGGWSNDFEGIKK